MLDIARLRFRAPVRTASDGTVTVRVPCTFHPYQAVGARLLPPAQLAYQQVAVDTVVQIMREVGIAGREFAVTALPAGLTVVGGDTEVFRMELNARDAAPHQLTEKFNL